MKHLKKIIFVVLPLAIWVTMIFYHGIILKPFSDLMMNISAPFVLSFVLHTIVQLLIISSLTVTAVKKLGYKLKYSIISVVLMYIQDYRLCRSHMPMMSAFPGYWRPQASRRRHI